jgi:hypothetical protein
LSAITMFCQLATIYTGTLVLLLYPREYKPLVQTKMINEMEKNHFSIQYILIIL